MNTSECCLALDDETKAPRHPGLRPQVQIERELPEPCFIDVQHDDVEANTVAALSPGHLSHLLILLITESTHAPQ